MSYEKFHGKINDIRDTVIQSQELEKGISIVIPVHDGKEFISSCLESIENQKINDAKFEVIIVLNGKFIEELTYLHSTTFNNLDIVILINNKNGAGSARNLGMKNARYSHVTFVDIDDYISQNYIQSNFDRMEQDTITFSQIHDVLDNEIIVDNPINKEIIDNQEKAPVSIDNINKIASITVCKVIPKEIIMLQEFRDYLRSGEDTVFYSELFINSRPKLKILPVETEAIYYRNIREDSVSRKKASFDFLVFQRLEILEILDDMLSNITNPALIKFVRSKYNAQISFMNRYLIEAPTDRERVIDAIENMSLKHFNYSILNRGFANTLVISYCFPPFSDTSATIVAKRLINNGDVVDVVSNNMSRIRHKELSLRDMVSPLVGSNIVVNQLASFSNMFYLNSFIDTAVRFYAKNKERYSKVYSRAMFPISHLPNIFIKIMNPNIKWTAEFSDPLLYDIESKERYGLVENEVFIKSMKNGLLNDFSKYVDNNLFNISELIPFALADELIFTNENQLEYMISRFCEDEKELIRKKSVIMKHPTLPNEYYNLQKSNIVFEESVINIAYFGNFYSKRSYGQFVELIEQLNANFNRTFKLHLYTNKNQIDENDLLYLKKKYINVNDYLSYTEFLNATTQYDILIISDANTKDDKPFNPYLPSKLSDYLGSGTPILALTEENSVMSKMSDDKLYKIDLDTFAKEIETNSISNNDILSDLVTLVNNEKKLKGGRSLDFGKEKIILNDEKTRMELTNDLAILNIDSKNWLIRPKELPVTTSSSYEIKIDNFSDFDKNIKIKSFYNLKNIITIELISIKESRIESYCISKLRNKYTNIEVPKKSNIIIKIKYKKNYKSDGFLNAGRLEIKGI
ncbi:glycosyltransferase [Corticicoccus populi]|uniref:Glycosyltransferase n=1 Tax=Corticicoccus populi TaxID=1812821 RepID=A0ABW5WT91_9STAP